MILLVLSLALVGLVVYLIETYIPMDPVFKTIIRIVVVICAVLWLARLFGVADLPLPHLTR